MNVQKPLIPRQPVPDLCLPIVGGGEWRLADQRPATFTMIVFYRGRHCPLCSQYLADLNSKVDEFTARGVSIFVASCDDRARAHDARSSWKLDRLTVGYAMSLDQAREWGLYISTGRGKSSLAIEEPAMFSEPGLFLVNPDQTLYLAGVQTMPFARPSFGDMLKALDFIISKHYLARGEVIDHTRAPATSS